MMVAGGMAYAAGRARRGDEPQDEQYEEDEQEYDAPPPAPPAPAAAAPADDATSELERLASMHDSGALSDDEFAAAKAKILGI
jgi:hypothetical protein